MPVITPNPPRTPPKRPAAISGATKDPVGDIWKTQEAPNAYANLMTPGGEDDDNNEGFSYLAQALKSPNDGMTGFGGGMSTEGESILKSYGEFPGRSTRVLFENAHSGFSLFA